MKAAKALMMGLGASGGAVPGGGLYVDDVFSAYTYTGNGSAQTITNGIDLAGHGGMVWIKSRNQATNHALYDTERGLYQKLSTNTTGVQGQQLQGVTAFNSNGYTHGSEGGGNASTHTYVSWTFRNAPRFYGHQVVTKLSGSNRTVNFPELGTLGMVRVKRTDQPGSWYVWHRSLPAGQLLIGETTNVAATLGHVTVSGTAVTLVNGVITEGTYLVEAWAHDEALDGIVQCGSFTTDAGGNATVNLGWEPQYILYKQSSAGGGDWMVHDSARGLTSNSAGVVLFPNTSSAEDASGSMMRVLSTGFNPAINPNNTYIYIVIRRPNKPPTSGTQVYNAIARTGTGAAATVTGVGFAPDLWMPQTRNGGIGRYAMGRLRGAGNYLICSTTDAEANLGNFLLTMDGSEIPAGGFGGVNSNGVTYINHFFRRAPGFLDQVCDTATGSAHTIQHNLAAVPQLMIRKARNASTDWQVWHSALAANEYLTLNSNAAKATSSTVWNNTLPTSSVFSVGTNANTNMSGVNYVTYLFSTLAGISKVGSYSGNGGTQTIACGFTTGSRFILIKRTDNTGDWFVWDTARGITPTTDPHLSLNTTAAEVTTDDSIDQDASGFVVNQNAATNINALGGNYLFLAIA